MRIHSGEKPYSCKECKYSSTRAHILKRRMLARWGEKPFHCTHCTSSFPQRGHFKEHMSTHSGERRFICNQWNYSCIQANDIKKHMPQLGSFGPSWQIWRSTSICCHPCSLWPIRCLGRDLHPWNWAAVTRKVKLSCHLGDPDHHLRLLDIAHNHIVNHFLGLTQQQGVDENDDSVHPFTCL